VRVLLAEDGDQDVRAGNLFLARGLDVQDGALDHALEASVGWVSTSRSAAIRGVCSAIAAPGSCAARPCSRRRRAAPRRRSGCLAALGAGVRR